MRTSSGEQNFQCPCCKACNNCKDFQKVIDLKDAGLVVYRHNTTFEHTEGKSDVLDASVETEDVFILHNTKDVDITSLNIAPTLERNDIFCPRCKHIINQAKRLLESIPNIQKNDIMSICEHCRKKYRHRVSCHKCDEAMKKFKASRMEQQEWLSNIQHVIKGILVDKKEPSRLKSRARTDMNIDKKLFRPSEKFKREPEVREMFEPEILRIQKGKSDMKVKDKKTTHPHFNEEDKVVLLNSSETEQQTTRVGSELSISNQSLRHIKEKIYTSIKGYKPDDKTEYFSDNQGSFRQKLKMNYYDSDSKQLESKLKHEKLRDRRSASVDDLIIKSQPHDKYFIIPEYSKKAEVTRSMTSFEQKLDSSEYDEQKFPSPIHKAELDTKAASKKIEPLHDNVKYSSAKSLPTKEDNKEDNALKEVFSYFFIKEEVDKKPPPKRRVSSSELIKDTEAMLRARAEEERKKLEEERKRKLEEEERKRIAREERRKMLEEMKRLAEEERKRKDEEERRRKEEEERKRKEEEERLKKEEEERKRKEEEDRKRKEEKETKSKTSEEITKEIKKEDKVFTPKPVKKKVSTETIKNNNEVLKKASHTSVKHIEPKPKIIKEPKLSKELIVEKKSKIDKEALGAGKEDEKERKERDKREREEKLQKEKEQKLKEKEEKERLKKEQADQLRREKEMEKEKLQKEKDNLEREKGKDKLAEENLKKMLASQAKEKADELWAIKQQQDADKKAKEALEKKAKEEADRKTKALAEKKAREEAELKLKSMRDSNSKPGLEEPKPQKKVEEPTTKELRINQIKVRQPSPDDLILDLVRLKQTTATERVKPKTLVEANVSPVVLKTHKSHKSGKSSKCVMCVDSELELDIESIMGKQDQPEVETDMADIIIGQKIYKYKPPLVQRKDTDEDIVPILFQTTHDDNSISLKGKQDTVITEEIDNKPPPIFLTSKGGKFVDQEVPKGIIRYALSDRTFIDKGWTMLPTEKVVRKMNVYRMRPAHPEFDWFEHNKNKRIMVYDTGEKLAEFDDNGRGRWFYRNGRLALDYYDAEEINAQQRFVIYSNGEPDERGRSRPITILATFDYLGNGVVFDHAGKIRLKYNQTEGVVLDRSIGPVSHWKWHTLNDPPVLQQVMIDTQMSHKDPSILKLGGPQDDKTRPDNEEMLAIEFDNFIKEKSKKLSQKFKPFQIKMKALKINENFSLRVLDQATIYLLYRDSTTNLKLNIGMILDHQEIVDTDTAEVGEVSNNLERFPAKTDSLAGLQRSVAYASRIERSRLERNRRLRPPEPCGSADQLTAAVSRPLRPPLRTAPSSISDGKYYCKCRKPSSSNVYYDTRLF